MIKNDSLSARVNLKISMETSILIEKESDKRGIHRAQFIKEAINDKLKKINKENEITLDNIRNELKEVKQLCFSILALIQK
tara:strand:- start:346 stop:588 length:243 start_codon:yes stop_codon:yes gene_type:complete